MKNTFLLKRQMLKKGLTTLILAYGILSSFNLYAQLGPIGPINPPGGSVDLRSSSKGMVNHFHKDGSGSGEDFYFSSGSGSWQSRVKFRIHTNGTVSTKGGVYADNGKLYLVADWDNSSSNEDIIFGFDNDVRSGVKEKMRLTDDGKLGIGTTAPKGMLHVTGSTYAKGHVFLHSYEGDGQSGTAYLQARDKSGNTNIGLQLRTQSSGNYKNAMKINSDGKVGIGTTTPARKLHVVGDTYTDGKHFAKGNVSLYANEGNNQSGTAYLQARDFSGNTDIGLQLRSQFAGSFINALKISPEGNIGIGATNPVVKLQVQGNIMTAQEKNVMLQRGALSDSEGLYLVGDRDNSSDGEDIIFGFDGNSRESVQERMRLTDEGNLGIGTNVPSEKLEVIGKIKASSFVTSLQSFPDYVFEPDYKKRSLSSVEDYVNQHKHLPNMPSEKEILDKGLDIPEVVTKSVENIEEIYLHLIELEKRIKTLEAENAVLRAKQQK